MLTLCKLHIVDDGHVIDVVNMRSGSGGHADVAVSGSTTAHP